MTPSILQRAETAYYCFERNSDRLLCLQEHARPGPARRFGEQEISPPTGKHWIWSQERIDEAMSQGLIVFSSGGLPYVKRYFDEGGGTRIGDIWTDINPINQVAKERLDYPTQKPEALIKE